MNDTRGLHWCALCLITACNGTPTNADVARDERNAPLAITSASAGAAAELPLNDEELDRLLDALEDELQTQQNPRR